MDKANAKREYPRRRPVKQRRRTRPFPTSGEDGRLEKLNIRRPRPTPTERFTVPASVLRVSGFFQQPPRVICKVRTPIPCRVHVKNGRFLFERCFQLPRIRRPSKMAKKS